MSHDQQSNWAPYGLSEVFFYYGFKFPFVLFPQPAVEHETAYQNLWLALFLLIDFVIHLHST